MIKFNPPLAGDYVRNGVVRNNIIKGSSGIQKNANQPLGELTIDHNFFACSSQLYGTNYLKGDPKWVNPSAGDYRLQSTSPAIDYGTAIDIVAFEYGSTSADIIAYENESASTAKSDWSTFTVSMSKTHIHNPIIELFLKMLERFPLLEKILKPILKLKNQL